MNAGSYQALKVAGRCTYMEACKRRPAKGHNMCATHHKKTLIWSRKSGKKTYAAKKIAGICVYRGCNEKASETSVLCERHRMAEGKRMKNPKVRASKTRSSTNVRKRWVREGKCGQCGHEPLVTTFLGERCKESRRLARRAKRTRPLLRIVLCSACRGDDHNITNCRQRYQIPTIDEFASARVGGGFDAAS